MSQSPNGKNDQNHPSNNSRVSDDVRQNKVDAAKAKIKAGTIDICLRLDGMLNGIVDKIDADLKKVA